MATAINGTGPVSDGSDIAYVQDLSGNARHLTQTNTTIRPSYSAAGLRTYFGDADYLSAPADITTIEGFIVYSNAISQGGVCALLSETEPRRYYIHISTDTLFSLDGANTATRGGAAVGSATYTPSDLSGDNISLPGAKLLENPNLQVLSFALSASNLIRNVGYLVSGSVHYTGPQEIAEVVLYSTRLTTDQRAGVIAELGTRHGA